MNHSLLPFQSPPAGMLARAGSFRIRVLTGCALVLMCAGGVDAKTVAWEYQVVSAGLNNRRLELLLNEKGAEGWELVQISSNNIAIFKRPKSKGSLKRK